MKIVQVINAMISKSDLISDVVRGEGAASRNEYYFRYNNKYTWSILYDDKSDDYTLYFYPNNQESTLTLARGAWTDAEVITFALSEIKTQEAEESYSELYKIVADKLHGLDKIFDDIING